MDYATYLPPFKGTWKIHWFSGNQKQPSQPSTCIMWPQSPTLLTATILSWQKTSCFVLGNRIFFGGVDTKRNEKYSWDYCRFFHFAKKISTNPWNIPKYIKHIQSYWKDSLHKQVGFSGPGYVPGVCWNLLRLGLMSPFFCMLKIMRLYPVYTKTNSPGFGEWGTTRKTINSWTFLNIQPWEEKEP